MQSPKAFEAGGTFGEQLSKVKSTTDLTIARVLDNREILGRRGFSKVELIDKIQAIFRGSMVRRRLKLVHMAKRLQKIADAVVE